MDEYLYYKLGIKAKYRENAVIIWSSSSILLHLVFGGFNYLLTWKAVGFLSIGACFAAIILSNIYYGLFFTMIKLTTKGYSSLSDSMKQKKVKRDRVILLVLQIVFGFIITLFSFNLFYRYPINF